MSGEVSGEEAAWRDLIARFELPCDTDQADLPWPESENLAGSPAGPSGPAGPDAGPGTGAGPAGAGPAEIRGSGTGTGTTAPASGRARIIRPAGTPPELRPPEVSPPAPGPPGRPAPPPGSAAGSGDLAQAGGRLGPADDDASYIPPLPPPLPKLPPAAKAAWAALCGGPAYLLVATLLGWQIPGWAALLAVTAFVGGFAAVILRMEDGSSRDDDTGNGAVL